MSGPRRNVRVRAQLTVTAEGDRRIDATTYLDGHPLWRDRGVVTIRTRNGGFIEIIPSPLVRL